MCKVRRATKAFEEAAKALYTNTYQYMGAWEFTYCRRMKSMFLRSVSANLFRARALWTKNTGTTAAKLRGGTRGGRLKLPPALAGVT